MADIVKLLDSRNRKGRIQQIVDTSFQRMMDDDAFFLQYMPVTSYADCALVWLNAQRSRPIASVTSVADCDGEIPNKQLRKNNVTMLEQTPFKISVQHVWKEDVFNELYKFSRDPGSNNNDVPQEFINFLYGDIEAIPEMILGTAKRYAWDVVLHGMATYRDEFTDILPCIDYTPLLVEGVNIPSALTGNKKWTAHATADGLADLHRHADALEDLNGYRPDVWVMNKRTFRNLAYQESTKRAFLARRGMVDASAADLAALELCPEDVMMAHPDCLEIRIFDGWYTTEDKDGNCERHYYLPDGYYVGLTNMATVSADVPGAARGRRIRGMGEIASVPTVESGRSGNIRNPGSVVNRMRSGIYTWTKEISDSPVMDAIKGVAKMIVKIHNPRTIASRKVY